MFLVVVLFEYSLVQFQSQEYLFVDQDSKTSIISFESLKSFPVSLELVE